MCALKTLPQNVRQTMPTNWKKQRTNTANQDTVQSMKSIAFKVGLLKVLSTQHFSAWSVSLEILTGREKGRIKKIQIWLYINSSTFLLQIVLYCIVVGSRRLMPPDTLQPKAYCTNPGLQSFLLAPPGVSTRDPSSERRNYLGEKMAGNFDRKMRLPCIHFRVLLHAANMRHWKNFRRNACWGFFRPKKSDGYGRVWTRELGYQSPARHL